MEDRKSTRLNSSHTVIYTLSLRDALPILTPQPLVMFPWSTDRDPSARALGPHDWYRPRALADGRSEEHTSELQSHRDLHSFPTRRSSDLDPPAPGYVSLVNRPRSICQSPRPARLVQAKGSGRW